MAPNRRRQVRLYDGLDWSSPGLIGPLYGVGDCIFDHEEVASWNWFDRNLPPRSGDVVLWYASDEPMPPEHDRPKDWIPQGEVELTKWLYVIDGVEWIVCKYHACKRDPRFHTPFARRVAEVRCPPGSELLFRADAHALAEHIRELRANPPLRPDVVVFPEGLFSPRSAPTTAMIYDALGGG
jgi:hypothetical protein